MKVKAEINLEDMWNGHEIGDIVANIVREEIKKVIRQTIKEQLRARKLELQQKATKMVGQFMGEL